MTCECCKNRNSIISLGTLLFGAILVITYLFLYSIKLNAICSSENETVWILIISILFAFFATLVLLAVKYYVFDSKNEE